MLQFEVSAFASLTSSRQILVPMAALKPLCGEVRSLLRMTSLLFSENYALGGGAEYAALKLSMLTLYVGGLAFKKFIYQAPRSLGK